ncbi:hypothetical protein KC19_5G174500 [Ceratodon purpureus]|uniref:Uncharacterized protein n=1 Tax=Ceratodon purpureus TaxID=3225 RepID=A0A8T0I450_CERPU|nr:hypothetical protein KC19_5G174500 [Ceratodon purpureus]
MPVQPRDSTNTERVITCLAPSLQKTRLADIWPPNNSDLKKRSHQMHSMRFSHVVDNDDTKPISTLHRMKLLTRAAISPASRATAGGPNQLWLSSGTKSMPF